MALFERVIDNSGDEHHEAPCERGGFGWPQNRKNPMGWGSDKPRRVTDSRPRMHGSRAERRLASGTGALIRQSGKRVRVTGEKPGKGKR